MHLPPVIIPSGRGSFSSDRSAVKTTLFSRARAIHAALDTLVSFLLQGLVFLAVHLAIVI
jgi:hypothetical protein